jgi:hypothetical protein
MGSTRMRFPFSEMAQAKGGLNAGGKFAHLSWSVDFGCEAQPANTAIKDTSATSNKHWIRIRI